jgi:hypothetical protein
LKVEGRLVHVLADEREATDEPISRTPDASV